MPNHSQFIFLASVLLQSLYGGTAHGSNDEPLSGNWAPSVWGAQDKVGSVNRTNPEMVLNAVKLVKQGKVATLGKVYQNDMPFFGNRSWRLTIPGLPPTSTIGPQDLVGIDEFVTA